MTSNIGSAFLQAEDLRSEKEFEEVSKQVLNALHGHFKPEFLNRVDDIIVLRPLGKEQLVRIIELRLEDVRRLLADRKNLARADRAAKDLRLVPRIFGRVHLSVGSRSWSGIRWRLRDSDQVFGRIGQLERDLANLPADGERLPGAAR